MSSIPVPVIVPRTLERSFNELADNSKLLIVLNGNRNTPEGDRLPNWGTPAVEVPNGTFVLLDPAVTRVDPSVPYQLADGWRPVTGTQAIIDLVKANFELFRFYHNDPANDFELGDLVDTTSLTVDANGYIPDGSIANITALAKNRVGGTDVVVMTRENYAFVTEIGSAYEGYPVSFELYNAFELKGDDDELPTDPNLVTQLEALKVQCQQAVPDKYQFSGSKCGFYRQRLIKYINYVIVYLDAVSIDVSLVMDKGQSFKFSSHIVNTLSIAASAKLGALVKMTEARIALADAVSSMAKFGNITEISKLMAFFEEVSDSTINTDVEISTYEGMTAKIQAILDWYQRAYVKLEETRKAHASVDVTIVQRFEAQALAIIEIINRVKAAHTDICRLASRQIVIDANYEFISYEVRLTAINLKFMILCANFSSLYDTSKLWDAQSDAFKAKAAQIETFLSDYVQPNVNAVDYQKLCSQWEQFKKDLQGALSWINAFKTVNEVTIEQGKINALRVSTVLSERRAEVTQLMTDIEAELIGVFNGFKQSLPDVIGGYVLLDGNATLTKLAK